MFRGWVPEAILSQTQTFSAPCAQLHPLHLVLRSTPFQVKPLAPRLMMSEFGSVARLSVRSQLVTTIAGPNVIISRLSLTPARSLRSGRPSPRSRRSLRSLADALPLQATTPLHQVPATHAPGPRRGPGTGTGPGTGPGTGQGTGPGTGPLRQKFASDLCSYG